MSRKRPLVIKLGESPVKREKETKLYRKRPLAVLPADGPPVKREKESNKPGGVLLGLLSIGKADLAPLLAEFLPIEDVLRLHLISRATRPLRALLQKQQLLTKRIRSRLPSEWASIISLLHAYDGTITGSALLALLTGDKYQVGDIDCLFKDQIPLPVHECPLENRVNYSHRLDRVGWLALDSVQIVEVPQLPGVPGGDYPVLVQLISTVCGSNPADHIAREFDLGFLKNAWSAKRLVLFDTRAVADRSAPCIRPKDVPNAGDFFTPNRIKRCMRYKKRGYDVPNLTAVRVSSQLEPNWIFEEERESSVLRHPVHYNYTDKYNLEWVQQMYRDEEGPGEIE